MKHKFHSLIKIIIACALIAAILGGCELQDYFSPEAKKQYEGRLAVHFLDVGQGDSIFIELPNDETMLIDAGENYHGEGIINYIKQAGHSRIDYVIGTNTKGNMFMTQAAAKRMIAQDYLNEEYKRAGNKGAIVNISSCSAAVSSTSRGEYCVSKAGISMLTTLYADRLAAEGITVNEVRPGIIMTDMTSTVKDKYDRMIRDGVFPIARWGRPEDVANSVSVFCSDKMRYTTGSYLDVDGGFHIQRL